MTFLLVTVKSPVNKVFVNKHTCCVVMMVTWNMIVHHSRSTDTFTLFQPLQGIIGSHTLYLSETFRCNRISIGAVVVQWSLRWGATPVAWVIWFLANQRMVFLPTKISLCSISERICALTPYRRVVYTRIECGSRRRRRNQRMWRLCLFETHTRSHTAQR